MNRKLSIDDGTPLYRVAMLGLTALSKDEGAMGHVVQSMKFIVLLGVIFAAWEMGGRSSDAKLDTDRVRRLANQDGTRKGVKVDTEATKEVATGGVTMA